ncbi:DMT family transporter [Dactylosporangium sp. CA-092794]|uniref:DMT family transporter n=1 Tax=Dactylosporangium sp. CA-092794 TaxID=3239929 RepID=UPI003D8B7737
MTIAAVLAALGSAAAFAVASVFEQRAAKRERTARPLDPRLVLRLMHQPIWLLAWIPEAAGTALQGVALHFGPLVLVEPLLVSNLFLAIPLAAALDRRRVDRSDFAVVTLGGAGLAAFLIAADPRTGLSEPSVTGWLGVGLWAGPILAACLVGGWCARDAPRGALLGIATGLLYGTGASLLKALTAQLSTDPLGVLSRGEVYALVIVGVGAVTLNQNAFQSGRIAVPLTAITIVDPAASVAIGVTAFHERLSTDGVRLAVQAAAVLAMAGAIAFASASHPHVHRDPAQR